MVTVTPLSGVLGARVEGLDIAAGLSAAQAGVVRDALAVTLGGGGDEVVQQIAGARDRVQHAGLKARHNHCSSPEV